MSAASAAELLANAQVFANQAVEQAQVYATVASDYVTSLDLPQYYTPVFDEASRIVSPLLSRASDQLLPLLSPYMDLAEPYLGGAKQHLDKISQQEAMLLIGGIFGGVVLLQLLFFLLSACRRGSTPIKAFFPNVFWLLLCFVIHSWIELNFVINRSNNKSGFQNGMNLYGAADFRYGNPANENLELEAGTAAMEAITAFITGPLSLLLAWGIVCNRSWRWGLQVIVCTCQMYGLAWFMAHPFFSLDKISSDDPFLYWVIFVGFNAPWGIIPPLMLWQALKHINKDIKLVHKLKEEEKKQLTHKKNK